MTDAQHPHIPMETTNEDAGLSSYPSGVRWIDEHPGTCSVSGYVQAVAPPVCPDQWNLFIDGLFFGIVIGIALAVVFISAHQEVKKP